jgi:hypothetical protein
VIEVSEGLVKVNFVEALHETDNFVVYLISTDAKRPEVISWNNSIVTILPADKDWAVIRPMVHCYTVSGESKSYRSVPGRTKQRILRTVQDRARYDSMGEE